MSEGKSPRLNLTSGLSAFLPLGFKSLKPWKMVIAIAIYGLIACMAVTLRVNSSNDLDLLCQILSVAATQTGSREGVVFMPDILAGLFVTVVGGVIVHYVVKWIDRWLN